MGNEMTGGEPQLVEAAIAVRGRAYAPYSNFHVGAAVMTRDGTVFTGCNVENASYGLCLCAERVAICSAVSAGYREFTTLVVAADPLAPPCGACRQFMVEFGMTLNVISVNAIRPIERRSWTITELLPDNFTL